MPIDPRSPPTAVQVSRLHPISPSPREVRIAFTLQVGP